VTEIPWAFSNIGVGQVFKSGSNNFNQFAKAAESEKGGRKMPPPHRAYEKISIGEYASL
jgi:hypothetical protein